MKDKKLKTKARNIYAIRQMDDLIMWIDYDKTRQNTRQEALDLKEQIMHGGLYTGGLELEEQDTEDNEKRKFCGVWVIQTNKPLSLKIVPRNINEQTLLEEGRQAYPRYLNAKAWTNKNYKKGMLIGNFHRIESQTTNEEDLLWAVLIN